MIYHEVQRLQIEPPLIIPALLIAALAVWGWRGIPAYFRTYFYLFLSIPVVAFVSIYLLFKIEIQVTNRKVVIDAAPFGGEVISVGDIARVETITYDPMRDFGGWGIRQGLDGKMYSTKGDVSVKITLKSKRIVYLGTDKPKELIAAIDR